jgi:hypothetical protein
MDVISIFPKAVIGTTVLNINENKILDYIYNLDFYQNIDNYKGSHLSYASFNINILNDLIDLKNQIHENIDTYLNKKLEYGIDFKINTSWATKTEINGYSQEHKHSHYLLSGVYYPKGNKNFKIKFIKDHSFWNIPAKNSNFLNINELTITIEKNNSLILFPSDVYHSVDVNLSNEKRYSIAFNVNPVGTIRSGDSTVTFY